ncbi:MAG: methionine adenosyltransferase [Chloroflexota bacterium]|nr:MAG: methionine adenosyltransferase [Chloroflexota bacterium]
MLDVLVDRLPGQPVSEQDIEVVERKGVGHPDTICDGIMEQVAQALVAEYRRRVGFIPHFNADKGLLVAGSVELWLGGGRVLKPMRLVFGDRATYVIDGVAVPIPEIVVGAAKDWIRQHLPHVDPDQHLVYQVELQPGSPELTAIFRRKGHLLPANDTSAAVGYAPLTSTELLVLETEAYLNSPDFKTLFPDTGQDVKVMGFRHESLIDLTVAMPFLSAYVPDESYYFRRKSEVADHLQQHLHKVLHPSSLSVNLALNTLDQPGAGLGGMYLSLLGTSAESGDSGEVGRGNRVNGLISLNRPSSAEAAAGKNPVSHIGKIYNMLAFHLAESIQQELPAVREAYVWLCSQIGSPIDQPRLAAVQLLTENEAAFSAASNEAREIVVRELGKMEELVNALASGDRKVF